MTAEELDEGILGEISTIEKPLAPDGEEVSDVMKELDEKYQEDRLVCRSRGKEWTLEEVEKVAKEYLFGSTKK